MGMDTRAPTTRRNGARSRRGGKPVTLPPPVPDRPTCARCPSPTSGRASGGRCSPAWSTSRAGSTTTAQAALVADFRAWARPPAGLRHPRVPTGHLMTVQSVCLGWHW